MIEQIEAAQPKYTAFVWIRSSWLAKKHSDRHIFVWAEQHLAANYNKVRVYPVLSRDNRVELWEAVE